MNNNKRGKSKNMELVNQNEIKMIQDMFDDQNKNIEKITHVFTKMVQTLKKIKTKKRTYIRNHQSDQTHYPNLLNILSAALFVIVILGIDYFVCQFTEDTLYEWGNKLAETQLECQSECTTKRDKGIALYNMCKNKYVRDTGQQFNNSHVIYVFFLF